MKKIYIVTSGIYSDYSINAVFSSKDLAQKYIDAFNNPEGYLEKMEIEEWELNPFKNDISKNKKPFKVWMDREGNSITKEQADNAYHFQESSPSYGLTHNKQRMWSYCFANDENHAVKIANERRIQMIANNQW